ncbi:MAG: hypothetical protein AAGA42_18700 [Actinomycetota bacterium]
MDLRPGAEVFRDEGITQLRSAGDTETHRRYPHGIGFAPVDDYSPYYELAL